MTGEEAQEADPNVMRTERLLLRRFELGDVEEMHAILSDPEAMRFWSTLPHTRRAETEQWIVKAIEAAAKGEADDFVVLRDGAIVGKAGLWRNGELGMIFARSVWGSGVAAEAVRAVIARAAQRGLQTITADVDPRNERALKFLARLGFVTTGEAKGTYNIGGEWADSIYLEMRRVP